jgi:hypothetical protein
VRAGSRNADAFRATQPISKTTSRLKTSHPNEKGRADTKNPADLIARAKSGQRGNGWAARHESPVHHPSAPAAAYGESIERPAGGDRAYRKRFGVGRSIP